MVYDQTFLSRYATLLGLDEFEIIEIKEESTDVSPPKRKTLTIHLLPKSSAFLCSHCGHACGHIHKTTERRVHDLPQGMMEIILVIAWPQMQCQRCNKYFTPIFEAIRAKGTVTTRLAERLAEIIRISTVKEAAKLFRIAESTAEEIYYEVAEARVGKEPKPGPEPIRSLGIDEIAVKKGEKITPVS